LAKITISGFMGSGKTLIGNLLSEKLNIPFYDLDNEIEKREKRDIKEIFKESGESYFRKIEKEVLFELLNLEEDFVLSLGGGTITNEESIDLIIKRSIPILLYGDIKIFYKRVKDSDKRPLVNDFQSFLKLYRKREKFYKKIPIKIKSDKDKNEIVNEIVNLLKRIQYEEPQKIIYELGITLNFKKDIFFSIIDNKVFEIFKDRFKIINLYIIKNGEKSKNLYEYFKILDFLSSIKFEKSDLLYGIGGGVVGDISGFVSSTYMRGVQFYLIPTTLLSQVDSSIGGKNGLNLKRGKNLVGTIYLPKETIIDPSFLFTLNKNEILSGLGEVFKYGILRENGIFDFLEEKEKIDFYEIIQLIKLSIEEKINFIKEDLFDNKNKRVFLNLGHTLGHALENITNYGKISHGEAVAFGILFSSYLSLRLKLMEEKTFERIFNVYKKIGFNYEKFLDLNLLKKEKLEHTLLLDKKSRENRLNLVLPVNIGDVRIFNCFNVDEYIKKLFEFVNFLKEEK
jgi:shikimate kinase/3-dehydroquinate synthase